MSMIQEFKQFAMRGNVVDLAVGVIIGGAFGKIISSMVDDIIMPPIGKLLGNMDFSNLYIPLSENVKTGLALAEAKKLGPVIAWGNFVTITLNFIIVAFCIFMVIKGMNAMKKKEEAKPAPAPGPTKEEALLTEIRDAIRAGK